MRKPNAPCVPPYASARCGGLGMPAGHGSIEQHRSRAIQRDRAFDNPTRIAHEPPRRQRDILRRVLHRAGGPDGEVAFRAASSRKWVRGATDRMSCHWVPGGCGRTIRIDHRGPIPPGSPLRLRGWLERLGDRSATFRVQAHDAHEVVCEATVTLVAAQRAPMESRIATKVLALQSPES